ncbi:MarR family winged helix-turn-helix transcriptional regulator [Streptococcus ovis]|uniref:MarR family winged helix-turn-helix transcriptional regulator n=1 Tax=Streptococcus ovis TaxID=82806 RepID=UPI0004758E05|nr:MarR family winged helix-turn-helix transcriptional regulator [Streptococcus ovis]
MMEMSSLLYQLKVTEQHITNLFEKQLQISLTRYELLQSLLEQSPCSQIALQERLKIDQAAITRHLRVLEDRGYVTRQRNPHNQREMLVELTQKARTELVESPPMHHQAVKEQMATILTEEESEHLHQLLDKIQTGLEAIRIDTKEK